MPPSSNCFLNYLQPRNTIGIVLGTLDGWQVWPGLSLGAKLVEGCQRPLADASASGSIVLDWNTKESIPYGDLYWSHHFCSHIWIFLRNTTVAIVDIFEPSVYTFLSSRHTQLHPWVDRCGVDPVRMGQEEFDGTWKRKWYRGDTTIS